MRRLPSAIRHPPSAIAWWVILLLCVLVGGQSSPSFGEIRNPKSEIRNSESVSDFDIRASDFSWQPSGPYGGEARRLAIDPTQPNVCYLGTGDGQVYRSSDGGQSWRLLQPGLTQRGFSIESLFVDVRAPHRLYVGGWMVRGGDGGGVFVSEDRGETWVSLSGIQGHAVRALVQAPGRPEVLIAGALDGVFQSEDGGANWRRISPEHPEFKNVESVAVDIRNPHVIYVGTWHLPWKTADGGKTWELIGSRAVGMVDDSDIFSIIVDDSNPRVVYMSACTGIYRSENAGRSWSKIQGIPITSRRTQVIRQHPQNPSVLYAGTTQGLWWSNDQGHRWQLLTDRRLVVNDVAINPTKPEVVMLATRDGVLLREGAHFVPSNNGFSHWTVSAFQRDIEKPTRLYAGILSAGLGAGLYVSEDQGRSWREQGDGLRGVNVLCFFQSPKSPEVMYAGTNQGLYRSDDWGRHWRRVVPIPGRGEISQRTQDSGLKTQDHPLISRIPRNQRNPRIAIRHLPSEDPRPKILALVPLDQSGAVLLLTEYALYRAHLEGGIWEKVYRGQGVERLMCVTTSQRNTGTIYLGSNQGLRISQDGGSTWNLIAVDGQTYPVQALAEDPIHSDRLFVGTTFGVFRLIWKKEAATWSRCGSGLPQISVSAIAISPEDSNELVVGDQRNGGLYRSRDRGEHWERIDSGFATSRVSTLMFDEQRSMSLYVGTFNGGIYIGKRELVQTSPSTSGLVKE